MKHITIVGAGLTGLSAAYHLRTSYDVFEQESEVGGLCRTMRKDGFLFDYTGHLLHLRQEYTRQLVQQLLPGHYQQHARRAVIYVQGRYVPYPFQVNLQSLPPDVIKECLMGFMQTLLPGQPAEPVHTFRDWALHTFGAGIAKYFMFPYNQKLWKIGLEELSADWVAWSIPKPTLEEILNGTFGIQNRAFGYNPTFLYPISGGAEHLPRALLRHLQADQIHYAQKIVTIDPTEHTISFADHATVRYDTLISTLPLKQLVAMLRDAPPEVVRAGEQLRYISVYNINIGLNNPHVSNAHWMYFPEPEFVFYRVGFPTNFSNNVAPDGCSSMYVEVSAFPDEIIPDALLQQRVYEGLQRCGLLQDSDDILVCDITRINCAYVLYDLHRTQALNTILPYLQQHQIYSTGRYGAWEYSAMEDAILAGKRVAEQVM